MNNNNNNNKKGKESNNRKLKIDTNNNNKKKKRKRRKSSWMNLIKLRIRVMNFTRKKNLQRHLSAMIKPYNLNQLNYSITIIRLQSIYNKKILKLPWSNVIWHLKLRKKTVFVTLKSWPKSMIAKAASMNNNKIMLMHRSGLKNH